MSPRQSYDEDSYYERSPRSRRRSTSRNRNEYYDDDYDNTFDGRSRAEYVDPHSGRPRSRSRSRSRSLYRTDLPRRSSSAYRRSPSPMRLGRRSPSPIATGSLGVSPSVRLSSSPLTSHLTQYTVGAGIPGTYYPAAGSTPYYSQSGYSGYQQLPAVVGVSPYGNRAYAGSSVGLPPPPVGQYLAAPGAMGHHRSRSAGSYGAVRPSFGY